MEPNGLIRKCTPTVSREWLFLAAGGMWLAVGVALAIAACRWLSGLDWPQSAAAAASSFILGIVVHLFGFSAIALKNIRRIRNRAEPVCLFGFQAWRSYLLIAVMMFFGYALRHLPIPRLLVSAIYLTIGTALTLGSFLYFQELAHEV